MDQKERIKIIKEQEERSKRLSDKLSAYREAEMRFNTFFLGIDETGDIESFGSCDKRSDLFQTLVEAKINQPEKYKEGLELINSKYPWFQSPEFKKSIKEWQQKQYEYYKELISFLNALDNDYKTYFSKEYKEKIFEMARHGLFVLYEMTPDFEPFLTDDVEDNINTVINAFSADGYNNLINMLSQVLSEEDPSDFLRTIKTRELREAVMCLINGCYGSCARTMFALIENEHTNASSLNADLFKDKVFKGKERSIAISEQLGEVNVSYFSECWELMNDYYREITAGVGNKSKRFINRNDVVHGVYWDSILPDARNCLGLILFYQSFKTISFFLQQVYDMKVRMKEDLMAYMASGGSAK